MKAIRPTGHFFRLQAVRARMQIMSFKNNSVTESRVNDMKNNIKLKMLAAVFGAVWLSACSSTADVTTADQVTDTAVTSAQSDTAEETSAQTTAVQTTAADAAENVKGEAGYTDIVILSTTDMHGKCWDKNVLTDYDENSNMLAVSSAVKEIRKEYGDENVILIDNGDLFQGAPVSQVQMYHYANGTSEEPLAMAVCLKEIGYDAFSPGNHEFNFNWDMMSDAYSYLQSSGVPVVSGNICYDGTDGVHTAG